MNLKEAFRYQNKLQSFMDEAQGILDSDANVTKVENTYLRHKVMAEAEDETVLIAPETEYYEQITDIAQFLLYLQNVVICMIIGVVLMIATLLVIKTVVSKKHAGIFREMAEANKALAGK